MSAFSLRVSLADMLQGWKMKCAQYFAFAPKRGWAIPLSSTVRDVRDGLFPLCIPGTASIDTAEAFAYLEDRLKHAKVPGGGINDLPDASVPALNLGYETTADTIAHLRAALAGLRMGKKLKTLF